NAGTLPLTIDRLLAVMLGAMYAIHRQLGWAERKPMTRADWILIALLAVLTLSTFTHDWRFQNSKPLFKLIQYFAIPSLAYWTIRQARLDASKVRWFFGILGL